MKNELFDHDARTLPSFYTLKYSESVLQNFSLRPKLQALYMYLKSFRGRSLDKTSSK